MSLFPITASAALALIFLGVPIIVSAQELLQPPRYSLEVPAGWTSQVEGERWMLQPAGGDPMGNLVVLSGRSCQLELYLGFVGRIATGKVLTLPAVSSTSLATTKELLAFTTPSGKQLRATATGNCGGPLSVGSAGTFAVGVLSSGTDVKFHIRNGIFRSDCHFETTPSLTVRKGWVITEALWNLDRDNDPVDQCRLSFGAVHFQLGINSYGTDSPHDERTLRALRTSGTCVPDEKDPLRNNHFLSLGLSKLTLVGPVGRSWQDAFE